MHQRFSHPGNLSTQAGFKCTNLGLRGEQTTTKLSRLLQLSYLVTSGLLLFFLSFWLTFFLIKRIPYFLKHIQMLYFCIFFQITEIKENLMKLKCHILLINKLSEHISRQISLQKVPNFSQIFD